MSSNRVVYDLPDVKITKGSITLVCPVYLQNRADEDPTRKPMNKPPPTTKKKDTKAKTY